MTTTEVEAPATGSTVVTLLERVWTRIREDHPEIPDVVIVTGSGQYVKWGHFRQDGWKVRDGERRHEMFLSGEALAKGARQTLQTMIHEAAHTLAAVRGKKDTSRQGRYHNKVFQATAEELGLEHKASSPDSTHGFSFVTLTAATTDRYADLLVELDREIRLVCHLPAWMGGTDEEDEKGGERITKPRGEDSDRKPHSGSLKAVCECGEPNIIRASKKVLEQRVIRCDDCNSVFEVVE